MVTGTEQILFTFLSQFECILYMHSYINSYMYFADRNYQSTGEKGAVGSAWTERMHQT